jgi:sirohydrochlorin ferrochelatase
MELPVTALILFSHGSLLCGAGNTLYEHAGRLRKLGRFDIVEVGYLNYSRPDFMVAVEKCAATGADRIVILPYFLVPGKFVGVDLPRRVAEAGERYPKIEFIVAEPIGFDVRLTDAILELAVGAHTEESWREDLRRAPEFCIENPRCPLFRSVNCPRTADLSAKKETA